MYRCIENRTADIISVLETEKEQGRAKRPWWVLRCWWDRGLERDIAMHRLRVERLKQRLDEVVFLWRVVSQDVRPKGREERRLRFRGSGVIGVEHDDRV